MGNKVLNYIGFIIKIDNAIDSIRHDFYRKIKKY